MAAVLIGYVVAIAVVPVFLNQSTAQYENSQRDGAIFDALPE